MSHTVYGTPVVHGVSYAPIVWTSRHPLPPTEFTELPPKERAACAAHLEEIWPTAMSPTCS